MIPYGMTKRQHEALCFIETYINGNGFSPSFEEIRQHLGLASKSGVHRIIHALADRGQIHLRPDAARSIAVGPDLNQALVAIGL